MTACDETRFLKDVAEHEMIVVRDDGVHRHIRFKRPESSSYYFDLITWPGYLCYTGDMGCYVFSRLEDMFEFFRTDRKYRMKDGQTLAINLGYWSEKLRAVDSSGSRGGSAKEFDPDRFRRVILEQMCAWIRGNGGVAHAGRNSYGLDKEERRDLWEAVREEVLDRAEDESRATGAAYDFHHKINNKEFYFQDFFDHRLTRYTFHFEWCCYALAWGIQKYDEAKTTVTESA